MIKAIFSDLDGTLIEGGIVSSDVLKLIKKVKSKGVLFSVVSGRQEEDPVIDIFKRVINDSIILENGSIILEKKVNKFIRDSNWHAKIIKYKKKLDKLHNKLLSGGYSVHKKGIIFDIDFLNYKNVDFTKFVDKNLKMEINGPHLDVVPKIAGKGNAINYFIKKYGIKPSQIACIGDNPNDKSMLELAGFPCVVNNASEELKQIVRKKNGYISKASGSEGGIEILNFLLNKI